MIMKKRKGVTYLMVIIIITISTSLIVMLFTSSKISLETTKLYSEYSNNYMMATTGAEKLCSLINSQLYNNTENIFKKVDENIRNSYNFYDIIFFEEGNFYFKEKDKINIKGEKNVFYKRKLFEVFYDNYWLYMNENYSFNIKNQLEDYLVNVTASLKSSNKFEVVSIAKNLNEDTSTKVKAILKLKEGYEKVKVKLGWETITQEFSYALVCNSLFIDENSLINSDSDILQNNILNINEFGQSSNNGDILLTNYLDVSLLEDKNYIIISENSINIINSEGKDFRGVIISLEDINFQNCNGSFYGNIISKNNVNLVNSNINLIKNENAIFEVAYENQKNYFDILNKLSITNFSNTIVDTSLGLHEMLKNAKITDIEVVELEEFKFSITQLIQE